MNNLPRIRIYSYVSLDGFTSATDGGMDWLTDYLELSGEDDGFAEFLSGTGCILMSAIYYATLQAADRWPFGDKPCYVLSPLDMGREPGIEIEFIHAGPGREEDLTEKIKEIRERAAGDIWLVGGNILISSLMDKNLIDELIVNVVPVTIGGGCRLFYGSYDKSSWILADYRKSGNDIIQLIYKNSDR